MISQGSIVRTLVLLFLRIKAQLTSRRVRQLEKNKFLVAT